MDGEATAARTDADGISTPLAVVFAGAGLTVVEALYYAINAELYAGGADVPELTATAVVVMNLVGMAFALAIPWYAHSVRRDPTGRSYLVVVALAVLSLVSGILLANLVTIGGGVAGYWERRGAG